MKSYLWSQKESYNKPSFIIEDGTIYTDDMIVYRNKFQLLKKEIDIATVFYHNNGIQVAKSKQRFIISGHYNEMDDIQRYTAFTYASTCVNNTQRIQEELIELSKKINRTINVKTINEITVAINEYKRIKHKTDRILLYLMLIVFILILTIINYKL
ncbi:hypothetical protein [Bacteroides sp. GM023]|uniref:hypothetical protein n=1 Tax=Bacteroides sp. GM023 TaxID=2723058 RepID=UPI00168B8A89|nr:hypothetical protein [Bacteroides sp. GM023]MBD3592310.1 hypothetical protein [Bacteroides sp. GM023]